MILAYSEDHIKKKQTYSAKCEVPHVNAGGGLSFTLYVLFLGRLSCDQFPVPSCHNDHDFPPRGTGSGITTCTAN